MTARRKSLFSLLLMGIVIGGVFVVFRAHNNRPERIIEGRPLSEWVRDVSNPNFTAAAPERDRAFDVLKEQPPTIIPELLQFHAATLGIGARFEKRFAKVGRRFGFATEPFRRDTFKGQMLRIISEIAQKNALESDSRPEFHACVNELTRCFKADPTNAPVYSWVIAKFGVNATNALPTLMQFLPAGFSPTNSGGQVILRAIADIGPGPYSAQVARVATNFLSSVDRDNIEAGLHALGACGTNASPFIPKIIERLDNRKEIGKTAVSALAQIGGIPIELKPRLSEWLAVGSGAAAVAMLEIDPKEPTALNIVQARLHPLAGRDHTEMIQLVSRVPSVAKLVVPELEKLARKTNAPTSWLARQTLWRLAAAKN